MIFNLRTYLKHLEVDFWEEKRDRLRPSILQFDFLVNQALAQDVKACFSNIRHSSKISSFSIVDIGCGHKPYLPLFRPYVKRYVGVDVDPSGADVASDAESLPFRDESFDIAVSFQTLEHCQNPVQVIAEMRRVLKKNGHVILTTHGSWMFHPSPHDYFRWTNEGLHYLCRSFAKVEIKANLKAWTSIIQIINLELFGIAARHLLWKIPLYGVIVVLNVLGVIVRRSGMDHFTVNYIVLARK